MGETASFVGRRFRGYRLEEKLDEGGMGVVYRATHELLSRKVAIKVLRPELSHDQKALRLLFDEARLVAQLADEGAVTQHICQVHDVGTQEGVAFLVMELLEGRSLASELAMGPLSSTRALDIARQILRVLATVHARGVVHRDLKPANIFICTTTNGVLTKVLDFGIAKIHNREFTVQGAGTPQYMAPEQLGQEAGVADTAAIDVYAMGLLLFEMVVGRRPTLDERRDTNRISEALNQRHEPVPSGLAPLLASCLVEQVAGRLANGGILLDALERVSVQPSPPSSPSPPPVTKRPTHKRSFGRWSVLVALGGSAAIGIYVLLPRCNGSSVASPDTAVILETPAMAIDARASRKVSLRFGQQTRSRSAGGTGGEEFLRKCGPDEVVLGLRAKGNTNVTGYLTELAPICGRISIVNDANDSESRISINRPPQTSDMECASGVLVGVSVETVHINEKSWAPGAVEVIKKLAPLCGTPSVNRVANNYILAILPTVPKESGVLCGDDEVITALHVRKAAAVDSVGLECTRIQLEESAAE
jgi:serine/threonine protein kinase